MRLQEWTPTVTILTLFAGTGALILLAFACGLRIGRWRARLPDPEPQLPARVIVASVLGLLSFILGFTFSVAVSHFDTRNEALDDEAKSIAIAFRRTDLLPEPERSKLRRLLREYVDLRLQSPASAQDKIILQVRALQDKMWSELIAVQNEGVDARPIPPSVVQTFNDIVDVDAERVLKNMQARLPRTIWFALYAITFVAFVAAGYQSGLAGAHRRSIAALAYALVFAGVIVMIADADTPRLGGFEASKQSFVDLRTRLNEKPR